jgi:glycosyltransferase involved in cell wall biosynthesis
MIHVRASNFFGGPEKQIVQHLLLLRESSTQAVLCSFDEAGKETELVTRARELGLASVSVPCTSAYDPRQIFRLRTLFLAKRPHIVCSHDYRSNLLCRLAARGLGVAQVAFWRGTTRENLKVRFYHWAERRLLRAAAHVVVVSKEQRDFLISTALAEERVSIVPNAVDVKSTVEQDSGDRGTGGDTSAAPVAEPGAGSEFEGRERRALLDRFSGKTILASAGRLSPEKGHEFLVRAVCKVAKDRPDVVLLIFGDGPLRSELTQLAERLGCGDFVHFTGFVPDFASLVDGIDVFVLPSLSEGLPNVLLEAMAAARPVVATAVGGVPELVTDGASGLLVSPGSSDEIAGAIKRLLSDTELAGKLASSGQETVRRSYSFDIQCRLLVEVYARVTSGR